MNILDLDLDALFQSAFEIAGSPVVDCNCGREHVCITSDYFDPDDDGDVAMVDSYQKRAKTDDKLILNYDYDSISVIEVDHRTYAYDCECGGYKRYMSFILEHRREIKRFLISVADKAQIALEHEKTFNVLKDKELEVLDRH